MTLPSVSIIVVNYNLKTFLKNLMESILQTGYPSFEILFIDNASTDQSVEYMKANFHDERLRINAFENNLGLYKAQNWAAKHAQGEYLCFLDGDVRVDQNWLLPMVETIVQDKSVGATQPLVGQMEDSISANIESEGNQEPAEIREVSYSRGACILVKREIFERLKGFDESCFFRSGDRDFGWRIWLYGYRCVQVSAARIYHAGENKQGAQLTGARLYHQLKNHVAMELEFGEAKNLLRLMPLFLARNLYRVKWGFGLDWKATVRAFLWVIKNMKLIMRKRRIIQSERRISDAVFGNKFPNELFFLGRSRII